MKIPIMAAVALQLLVISNLAGATYADKLITYGSSQ